MKVSAEAKRVVKFEGFFFFSKVTMHVFIQQVEIMPMARTYLVASPHRPSASSSLLYAWRLTRMNWTSLSSTLGFVQPMWGTVWKPEGRRRKFKAFTPLVPPCSALGWLRKAVFLDQDFRFLHMGLSYSRRSQRIPVNMYSLGPPKLTGDGSFLLLLAFQYFVILDWFSLNLATYLFFKKLVY